MPGIAAQFAELPMGALIGGPLKAIIEAQSLSAIATADFIKNVGFKGGPDQAKEAIMVSFKYMQPVPDGKGGMTNSPAQIDAPLITLMPIPCLLVSEARIAFEMTVTQSECQERSTEGSAELGFEAGWGWGKVKISGKISHKEAQTRKTDTSAKYDVEVKAAQAPVPEGLHRILDIFQEVVKPKLLVQPTPIPAPAPTPAVTGPSS